MKCIFCICIIAFACINIIRENKIQELFAIPKLRKKMDFHGYKMETHSKKINVL